MQNDVNVPASPGVQAEVNPAPVTTMYWHGIAVQVPSDRVGTFQAQGYLLFKPEDLSDLAVEVDQLCDEAAESFRRFCEGVLENKQIDPGENSEAHALQQVMNRLYQRIQDGLNVAYQNYPVVEAEESPQRRTARIRTDAEYHGVDFDEMKKRYGMEE